MEGIAEDKLYMTHKNKQYHAVSSRTASLTLKIVAYSCFAVGLSSFWWIVQTNMDNTRNYQVFYVIFAVLGLIISIPFYIIFYKTIPELKNKQSIDENLATCINSFALGLFFMIPSIASSVMKNKFIKSETCNEYRVKYKTTSGVAESKEFYFFVEIEDKEEKIIVPSIIWDKFRRNDNVKLCIKKGILGIEYINYLQ